MGDSIHISSSNNENRKQDTIHYHRNPLWLVRWTVGADIALKTLLYSLIVSQSNRRVFRSTMCTLSDAYGEVENSTGGENAGHRAAYSQKEAAGERSGTPEEAKKEQRFRNGHVNLF